MMTPAWILDVLAALMLAVAAVSAARLAAAGPRRGLADADIAHLLMAIAMAGALVPSLTTVPDTAWEVVFGLMTAWFVFRVWRDARANGLRALASGHCAPHLVHSGAMLYMFLALAASAGGKGTGGVGGSALPTLEYPTLAFVFTMILAGYSVWDIDQLSGRRYGLAGVSVAVWLPPAGLPAMTGAGPAALAIPQGTGTSAVTGATSPALSADEAVPTGGASAGEVTFRAVLLSPGTTVGCRVAMGVTMAFMLAIMI
jgi:hypothetical protein